jgi:serine/threonine protein kinase
MAPEVVAVLDGKRGSYDEKSDGTHTWLQHNPFLRTHPLIRAMCRLLISRRGSVWALGMVLFEMLTCRLPYEEVGLLDVRDHVL